MINFQELLARDVLASVEKRARDEAEVYEILENTWDDLYTLLPPVRGLEGNQELEKIEDQITSMGPEIIGTKLEGIVGNITWGEATTRVDAQLEALDLRDIANNSAHRLIVSGIAAVFAYVDLQGVARLQRLGGHLMPIYADDDVDRIIGLFQSWMADAGKTWTTRIYDFEERRLREWRDIASPTALGGNFADLPLATLPVVTISNRLQDGIPQGELWQHIGLIKQEMVAQAVQLRVSRRHAYPLTIVRGPVDENRSSVGLGGVVYFVDNEGGVERLEPGDLSQLFEQHNALFGRIRSALNLPPTFGGANIPSGEALLQANQRYSQSCNSYSMQLTRLLTEGVKAYASLLGIQNPPPVQVYPNLLNNRAEIVNIAKELYQAEILPLEQAMRLVHPYIPTWEDDKLEEDVQRRTTAVTMP